MHLLEQMVWLVHRQCVICFSVGQILISGIMVISYDRLPSYISSCSRASIRSRNGLFPIRLFLFRLFPFCLQFPISPNSRFPTTDVNSIMKVKEYRFHIPIYHYFLGTTVRGAPRMHCNRKDGVNCRDSFIRQVGSPNNPELYGNARMPCGHSRRTTELGRVECYCPLSDSGSVQYPRIP
jgi:hypothetical protein